MTNQAVNDFNNQLRETIRLLEREENVLKRRQSLLKTSSAEERIIDEVRRYT